MWKQKNRTKGEKESFSLNEFINPSKFSDKYGLTRDYNYKNVSLVEGMSVDDYAEKKSDVPSESNDETAMSSSVSVKAVALKQKYKKKHKKKHTRPGNIVIPTAQPQPGQPVVESSNNIEFEEEPTASPPEFPDLNKEPKVGLNFSLPIYDENMEQPGIDQPFLRALIRLSNKIAVQLNFLLGYVESVGNQLRSPNPDAFKLVFHSIILLLLIPLQLIFLLPNLFLYTSELLGIFYGVAVVKMFSPDMEDDKFTYIINESIKGMHNLISAFAAFYVSLNLWYVFKYRKDDTNYEELFRSMVPGGLGDTLVPGFAGPINLMYWIGPKRIGEPYEPFDESMGGAKGMYGGEGKQTMFGGMGPLMMAKMANSMKMVYDIVKQLLSFSTLSFSILFLFVYWYMTSGGLEKLMNTQSVLRGFFEGDTGNAALSGILTAFCLLATFGAFFRVHLPHIELSPQPFYKLFKMITSPISFLIGIIFNLIITMILFQFGSIIAGSIVFYFMYFVLLFRMISGEGPIIFASMFSDFETVYERTQGDNVPKSLLQKIFKVLLNYGVYIVLLFVIIGSFISVSADMATKFPPEMKAKSVFFNLFIMVLVVGLVAFLMKTKTSEVIQIIKTGTILSEIEKTVEKTISKNGKEYAAPSSTPSAASTAAASASTAAAASASTGVASTAAATAAASNSSSIVNNASKSVFSGSPKIFENNNADSSSGKLINNLKNMVSAEDITSDSDEEETEVLQLIDAGTYVKPVESVESDSDSEDEAEIEINSGTTNKPTEVVESESDSEDEEAASHTSTKTPTLQNKPVEVIESDSESDEDE